MSGILSGLAAVLLWGAAPVTLKAMVGTLPGMLASAAIYALAALITLPWLWRAVRQGGVTTRTWLALLVVGVMLTSAFNLLVSLAAANMRGTTIGAIVALEPLMVALIASGLSRHWPTRATVAALLLSLVGVWLLVAPSPSATGVARDAIWAMALVLLGAALWSLAVVLAPRVSTPWQPLQTSMVLIGIGSLPFLLAAPFLPGWSAVVWSPGLVAGVCFMAIGATVLANVLWLRTIRAMGPVSTSLLINLVPLTAVTLSVLWLGESWTIRQLVGALLVLGGLSLPTLLQRRAGTQSSFPSTP